MKLLQGLGLVLLGALVDTRSVTDLGHNATAVSSAGDTSPADGTMPPVAAETTPSSTPTKRLLTITHSLARGATALPNGGPSKPGVNETLADLRRHMDAQLSDAETMVFEIREEEDRGHGLEARVPTKGNHNLHFFREWIWCHSKGFDPWLKYDPITDCMWAKANGEGDGKFICDDRQMYLMYMTWANRTRAVFGCGPCFTWCFGRKHAWCDCTAQTDFHTTKAWMGYGPLEHTYRPGWQESFTQYLSTTFLGQWVGTGSSPSWRQKRDQPQTAQPPSFMTVTNSSSATMTPRGIESWANDSSIPWTGSSLESFYNRNNAPNATAIKESSSVATVIVAKESSSNNSISSVQQSPNGTASTHAITSTRKSTVRPHITPRPRSTWRRGGAPEWHTFTPEASHTAAAVYSSILAREGIIDASGTLNETLIEESSHPSHNLKQYNETANARWHNATRGKVSLSSVSGTMNSTTTMELDARAKKQQAPWHWINHPPQGLSCFSQGYSPLINESMYYYLKNTAEAGRTGEWRVDMPWDVNMSIVTTMWHSTTDCIDACKDCIAWGIKDQRNLVWCDYRYGYMTQCHVGFEPVDTYNELKTDWYGDYITEKYPTATDQWYSTPPGLVMASGWHVTPWLPITPVVASTHFYDDGQKDLLATHRPPYWDVYCTAAYAGAELSEWSVTHTRTNWDWHGWYTSATSTPRGHNPFSKAPPSHSRSWATVYPTPVTKRSGAEALRVEMADQAASQQDCYDSCDKCIDWAFWERRGNVSCTVKRKHENESYVGLCEADFSLKIWPTTLPSSSATPTFTPSWPTTWDKPKIINGTATFSPVVWTVTSGKEATLTTEWWHGKTRLPEA